MYVQTLQDYVIVSLHFVSLGMITLNLLACGWCWCELVYPVPMLIGRLPLSLSSASWTVHRCPHFPPMLFGLATLVWVVVLVFSIPHLRTCCYKVSYHTHSWISSTYICTYFLSHWSYYWWGSNELAAPNPFCPEHYDLHDLLRWRASTCTRVQLGDYKCYIFQVIIMTNLCAN
jgi:hypothetical protein